MKLTNFIENGEFYKANYHTHSQNSDGQFTQEEVINMYKEQGYSFLCMSEHNRVTKTTKYDTDSFKLVPGLELHCVMHESPLVIHHMLGLASQDNEKIYNDMRIDNVPFTENNETLLALEKTLIDLDLLTVYCHPTWSHVETPQFDFLKDTEIMEVCNFGTIIDQGHNNDPVYWDSWLKQGKQIFGMANDDSHRIQHFCGGWNMVKCKEFTVPSMLDSLRKGSFYCTMGPFIDDFYIEDGYAVVKCSEAKSVTVITQSGWGKSYRDPKGKLTEVVHNCPMSAYSIRVEVEDMNGNIAWSNPITRMDRFQYR
ncbi:MAG: hypothetical protein WCY62_07080 [Clostridia bacterium]|jgi:hypothetical protein